MPVHVMPLSIARGGWIIKSLCYTIATNHFSIGVLRLEMLCLEYAMSILKALKSYKGGHYQMHVRETQRNFVEDWKIACERQVAKVKRILAAAAST